MPSPVPSAGTEVTREDQQKINTFGRLHTALKATEAELKSLQQEQAAITDASSEALLAEEAGAIKLRVGEAFFDLETDEATEALDKREEECQKKIAACEEKLANLRAEMAALKSELYGKFGKAQINLDD